MNRELLVIIGCDTDPDRASYLSGELSQLELSWRGMLEGIPKLKEQTERITDDNGSAPKYTWCLRADFQIKRIYGTYNHVLTENRDFLTQLEQSGDELAWHPHFWNFDEQSLRWYQDTDHQDWRLEMLDSAFAEYQSALPGRGQSVRMGWDYHDVATFAKLEELGVKVDFSAIPRQRTSPHSGENFFDWYDSPNHPYYGSRADHRREADRTGEAFRLVEAPNFVSTSRFWSFLAGVHMSRKMKDWGQLRRALLRPSYWIGITGQPRLFAPLARHAATELRKKERVFFVTYFHPDELLPASTGMYARDYLGHNLTTLVSLSRQQGARVRFITASQIPDFLDVKS